MTTLVRPGTVLIRSAQPPDNKPLIALAAACPMVGDITMCVERSPDFFALPRLEGDECRVGVADIDGEVAGCIMAATRHSYLNGIPVRTGYGGDLKVHPPFRGGPSADALIEFVRETLRNLGGDTLPLLSTALAGNRPMERRASGPRGLPVSQRFATIDVHAVPFLWRRSTKVGSLRVEPAREEDVAEMADLWAHIAPSRQLASVLDADALSDWVRAAPGLSLRDYLVARNRGGRIVGFAAFWQQRSFKQLRVLAYSPRLAIARVGVNAVARITGGASLPVPGALLSSLAAVHVCTPMGDAGVLRALLLNAYAQFRETGNLFFTIALDRTDPARAALAGLHAQPTAVNAFMTTPAGRWTGGALDERPLYFDSALV